MIWHFSTSPYLSKSLVTSCSERRGWIPVTNRLEPGLTAPSSWGGPRSFLGPLVNVSGWKIKGGDVLTGCLHGRWRWERQSGEDHREGYRCDELGEVTRCDHVRNEEPHLRIKDRVSKIFRGCEADAACGRDRKLIADDNHTFETTILVLIIHRSHGDGVAS